MKKLQLFILVFALGFYGCSSNNDEEIPDDKINNGTFSVSLSGAESRSVKGEAYFVHAIRTNGTKEENGSVLSLNLVNDQNEDELITILVGKIENLNGIGTGTYSVNIEPDDNEHLVNIGALFSSSPSMYLATSGQVTLKKINNTQVEGSITANLDNFNGKTLTITGMFDAEGITQKL
jgi:hypothetical protein